MVYSKEIEELGLLREKICLDFINSTGSHPHREDNDFLYDYAHLVTWAEYVGLLEEADVSLLLQDAEQQPAEAMQVLEQAIALRETLYRILAAEAHEVEPDEADMAELIQALTQALPQMRLVRSEHGHYEWAWSGDGHDLARMLWPVVWSAAELLKSDQLQLIRQCAGETCDWLFLDTSRNHSRRWCDMQSCGNRAKARTHYHRTRDPIQDE